MPQITLSISEDDEKFLRAMASISQIKSVDLNEHDGYRLVHHSTRTMAEQMLHRSILEAEKKLREVGINRFPW